MRAAPRSFALWMPLVAAAVAAALASCDGGGASGAGAPGDAATAFPDDAATASDAQAVRDGAADAAGDAVTPSDDVGPDVPAPPDIDPGILDPRVTPVAAWPYVFDDDEGRPEWARFRAEGLPFEESVLHALDYARKFTEKVFTAPSAAIASFDRQRALFAALAAREESAGAAETTTLGLVGDIMWIRRGWDTFPSDEVLRAMAAADAWIGNLESPIDRDQPVPTAMPDYREYNADPGLVRSFRRPDGTLLFGAVSFANNHVLDMQDAGAIGTLAFLDEEGVPVSGVRETSERPRWVTFERGSFRFGFYAASWGINAPARLETTALDLQVVPGLAPPGSAPVDLAEIRSVLGEMTAAGVDVRVVMLHWGHEYEYYPTALQARIAREIVTAGADLLVGSHSHVQQPDEVCFVNGYEARYAALGEGLGGGRGALEPGTGCLLADETGRPRKALVVYSLGNFVTTMATFLCQVGQMQTLVVYRDAAGAVDWDVPRWRLVYNDRSGADGHRTLLLDEWMADGCGGDACGASTLDQAAFLRDHLGAALSAP